jgi:phage baseplate assembly protein W
MPLERVSKGFKDVSMSFQTNPLTNDIIAIKNETSIARSIRNIVFTYPGEKFFNQEFGSRISRSVFENIDQLTASNIKDEIQFSIINYEPRVSLLGVVVNPDYDNNSFDVLVNYRIVGIDVPPQQLQFVLQPNR